MIEQQDDELLVHKPNRYQYQQCSHTLLDSFFRCLHMRKLRTADSLAQQCRLALDLWKQLSLQLACAETLRKLELRRTRQQSRRDLRRRLTQLPRAAT